MRVQILAPVLLCMALMGAVPLAFTQAAAQSLPGEKAARTSREKAAAKKWRTPWGDPDLQGSWSNAMTVDGYDAPITLAAKLTISRNGIDIDFSGTSGLLAEAIAQLKKVLELEPTFLLVHPDLGRAYAQMGQFDRAIEEFRQATVLAGGLPGSSAGLAHTLAIAGHTEEARAMLPELEARVAAGRMNPYAVASVHAGLGDAEHAMTWLERAFEQHDGGLVWLDVHPRLEFFKLGDDLFFVPPPPV